MVKVSPACAGVIPIEKLADRLQAEGIPTDGYEDMDEDKRWEIRDRINQIADEI